jgi:hypothetical protein
MTALLLVFGPRFIHWYHEVPTITLSEAVADFNLKSSENSVGKLEPLLTENEVVAAINAQLASLPSGRQH